VRRTRVADASLFFHIRDDDGIIVDEEGMEFPSAVAARQEAEASARDLLAEMVRSRRRVANRILEVADEHGTIVDAFPLKALLN
jgi:hypothetical protein